MPHDFLDDPKNLLLTQILEPLKRAALSTCFPAADDFGNPSLSRFFLKNGRLPFLTDEIKPWKYRGWHIPYQQMAEAHPMISPRYDYVSRTIEAGRLLDEPIPQIQFVGEFEQQTKPGIKMLNNLLDHVAYKSGSYNGMRELCEWIGFAVGVIGEPSKLETSVQDFLYRNFNMENLLLHPSDYLGQILTESQYGKRNGFYPTPINICELMSAFVHPNQKVADSKQATVCDPCVGTGRMLMVASNYSLRLFGQDIDYLCCLITKINLAFYAPWFYIPDSFFEVDQIIGETIIEIEVEVLPSNEFKESALEEPIEEVSLFEKLRSEKQAKKKSKFSTEIENLPLFDFG